MIAVTAKTTFPQQSGGIAISTSVPKAHGFGIWGYGLVVNTVLPGKLFDLMILQGFFNLNKSMI